MLGGTLILPIFLEGGGGGGILFEFFLSSALAFDVFYKLLDYYRYKIPFSGEAYCLEDNNIYDLDSILILFILIF